LGISQQMLCDIEKARRYVSANRAAHFAEILDQSVKVFVKLALQDHLKQGELALKVSIA
jgi:hypothetical protein